MRYSIQPKLNCSCATRLNLRSSSTNYQTDPTAIADLASNASWTEEPLKVFPAAEHDAWNLPEALSMLLPADPVTKFGKQVSPYPKVVVPDDFLSQPVLQFETLPFPHLGDIPSKPTGTGSVKAVKVQTAGRVTSEIDILSSIKQIAGSLVSPICGAVDEMTLNALTILPVLRGPFNANEAFQRQASLRLQSDPTHRGQLFINFDIDITKANFGCGMEASVLYDINIDQSGALVATAAIDFSKFSAVSVSGGGATLPDYTMVGVNAYSGGGCEDLLGIQHGGKWLMRFFLDIMIPFNITSGFHLLQSIRAPLSGCDPTLGPEFDPYKMGYAIFGPADTTGGVCFFTQRTLCDLIRLGFRASLPPGRQPSGPIPTKARIS